MRDCDRCCESRSRLVLLEALAHLGRPSVGTYLNLRGRMDTLDFCITTDVTGCVAVHVLNTQSDAP